MRIDFKNKEYVGSNLRKSLMDCKIPESPKAVIVFLHGYKGYKDWGAWQLMEDYFVKKNYGFVKFNLSHNGGTVDQPIDFPDLEAFGNNRYSYEKNDLNIIIEETDRLIRQECELDIPIYLIGHSRGGGVAILVAAENPKIKKLISLAGICDIESRFPTGDELADWRITNVRHVVNGRTNQNMPHYYSFYQDFEENKETLNIEAACQKLTIPFLQIHGDMDLAVSISEGQNIAKWTETDLGIVKGAGHTFGAVHPWNAKEMPEDMLFAIKKMSTFLDE